MEVKGGIEVIGKIKTGITQKLNHLLGEEYQVYTEEAEQGFVPPAFFIKFLSSSQKPMVGRRYLRDCRFVIEFFPEKNGTELEQCQVIAEELLAELEYITVDGELTRGSDLKAEIIEGVLHFYVNYKGHGLKPKVLDEYMGRISQNGFVKG